MHRTFILHYIQRKEGNILAKKTTLNDDAQLYQPRDTRSEREKFQSMNWKERLQYFSAYYRNQTIAGIALIAFLGYLCYTIFTPKAEPVLYAAIIDGCIDHEIVTTFQSDMTELLAIDPSTATVVFDDSFYLTGNADYSNQQKLVLYVAGGDIDLIIAPEEIFAQYADAQYFMKLSECLPPQKFSALTDYFYYYKTVDDTQEACYGIYLDEYQVKDQTGTVLVRPVVGILANTSQTENAVTFIDSILFR